MIHSRLLPRILNFHFDVQSVSRKLRTLQISLKLILQGTQSVDKLANRAVNAPLSSPQEYVSGWLLNRIQWEDKELFGLSSGHPSPSVLSGYRPSEVIHEIGDGGSRNTSIS
jgi:hypothetical protein